MSENAAPFEKRATLQSEPATDVGMTASGADTPVDERPEIRVRAEFAPVVDEALAALAASATAGLYVRGRALVRVVNAGTEKREWLRRAPGAPVIVTVTPAGLRERIDRSARWTQYDGRRKMIVPALPPEWVAGAILDRGEWPFPNLVGVVETPTLRPDGSILDRPGHDESTGLLYVPTVEVPAIPERPTLEDAKRAAEVLLDPFRDFPFRSNAARAATLSAILTLVARPAIDGPCPMFPVNAPTPGSGKDLLVNAMSLAGAGRRAASMTYTTSDEEMRKRILAMALEGDASVSLGNVEVTIGSDALAHALTSVEWKDRQLGHSKMASAPLRTVWFATGNNLRFARTLGRRGVPIDLDPGMENPEDRDGFTYKHLLRHVEDVRPQLVRAALTILRAYFAAGRPQHGRAPMGSFEAWDALVRACVVWLGFEDPAGVDDATSGRGRLRAESDDDLDGIASLLVALREKFGDKDFAAKTVAQDEALRGLAAAVGPRDDRSKDRKFDTRAVGNVFKAIRDRIVSGHKLVRAGDGRAGAAVWLVTVSHSGVGAAKMHAGDDAPLSADRPESDSPETHASECVVCGEPAATGASYCPLHFGSSEDVESAEAKS